MGNLQSLRTLPYLERLKVYEQIKIKLRSQGLGYQQYEKRVKFIVEALGL